MMTVIYKICWSGQAIPIVGFVEGVVNGIVNGLLYGMVEPVVEG